MYKYLITTIFLFIASHSFAAWSDVNIWVANTGTKYRQGGEDGTSGASNISLTMAKNEFEPFQIITYNAGATEQAINDVTVTQTSGPGTIDNIVVYRQHYLTVTSPNIIGVSVDWSDQGSNVWRKNIGTVAWLANWWSMVSFYIGTTDGGCINFHEGARQTDSGTINAAYRWSYSAPYLYVYSVGNPTTVYSQVRAPDDRSNCKYAVGNYPDPLVPKVDRYYGETRDGAGGWPATGIPVAASQSQSFWVDIGTTTTTTAGVYTFAVAVKQTGQADKTATITLTVKNFTLPSTASIRSFITLETGNFKPAHGLGSASTDATTAGLEYLYSKALLYHRLGLNTGDGYLYNTVNATTGAVTDWTNWEIAYKKIHDGTAITSGTYAGAIASATTMEFTSDPGVVYDTSSGKSIAYYQSWFDKFTTLGLAPLQRLFIMPRDEPRTTPVSYRGGSYTGFQVALLKTADLNAVNTGGLGTWKNSIVTSKRVTELSSPGDPYVSLDTTGIYVVPMFFYQWRGSNYSSEANITYRNTYPYQSEDVDNWINRDHFSYIACDQAHGCNVVGSEAYGKAPDLMLESSPAQTRALGWLLWYYRSHGFLYYDANLVYGSYGTDPWYNMNNQGGNGEGQLFYPGVPTLSGRSPSGSHTPAIGGTHDIPIESMRMKYLREAQEDREYFELMRNASNYTLSNTYVNSVFGSLVTPGVAGEGVYWDLRNYEYITNAREYISKSLNGESAPSPVTIPSVTSGRYTTSKSLTLAPDYIGTTLYCTSITGTCTPNTTYSAAIKVLQNVPLQYLCSATTDLFGTVGPTVCQTYRKQYQYRR